MFKEHLLILSDKNAESGTWSFFGTDECVWSGPPWLTLKTSIHGVGIYYSMELFFRTTLGVHDMTWQDCVAEIETMKESVEHQSGKALEIYRWMWQDFRHHRNFDELRYASLKECWHEKS